MSPLTSEQQQGLRDLGERYRLDLLLLFGSRARGRERAGSDHDIGVVDFSHPLTEADESRLVGEMYELFRTDAVDLVVLRRVSPLLQFTVATEGIVLYAHDPDTHRRYRWRACKLWEDNRWRHVRRQQHVKLFLQRAGLG